MTKQGDPSRRREAARRAALNSVYDLVYIYDESCRLVYANQAFVDLFDVTLEDIEGRQLPEFAEDDDVANIIVDHVQYVASTGETVHDSIPYTSPAGDSGHFEYILRRYQHDGEVWVIGSTREISDRIRLSEEIERKNHQLSEILESITDAFFAVDDNWAFTYVNERASQLLQRSRDQLLGRNLWEEFPEALNTQFETEYVRAMAEQVSASFEQFFEPLDTWFEVHAYPSPGLLSVYFRDINERIRLRQELAAKERRYRTLTNAMPQMVWVADPNGYHFYYNDRWYEFTGLTAEESIGFGFTNALHPADLERTVQAWERTWKHGEDYEIEYRFYSRDLGEYRWFLGRAYPVRDDNGDIIEWVGTCTDIHPQKEAERKLIDGEQRLEDAQRIAQIGNWEFNVKTGAFSCSREQRRIFGFDHEDETVSAQRYIDLVHPDDRATIREQRDRVLEQGAGSYDVEYRIQRPDGEERILRTLAELVLDEDDEPERFIGIVHDITHRREIEQSLEDYARQQAVMSRQLQQLNSTLEQQVEDRTAELRRLSDNLEQMVWERTSELEKSREQLAHQAQHDQLTGLPNRILFEDRLDHAIANADRTGHTVGVMFIDLDGFKLINDSFGHAAGDKVLKALALRLQARIRRYDTLARHGGDEFMVVLENMKHPNDAYSVAQDFLEVISKPIDIGNRTMKLSGSIGVALYPQDAQTVSGLQRQADIAMYRAKFSGKNDVRFYSPAMNAAAEERLEIAAHLSSALDSGELDVSFQPQVDAASGRIESFEALLRWHSGGLGYVSPGRLIPIAEETGQMNAIGTWILDQSCREAAIWSEVTGTRVRVSVNVSASQFDREDFVSVVSEMLDRHRLVPSQLELELTEHSIVEDLTHASVRMAELRRIGVRIAMDDFGLGSSSLSNLVRLPIDTVKIDRAFVRDLPESSVADRVVQAIVSLSNGMGLVVVAEGIETEAQRERVVELGCDRLQGHLLGQPLDATSTRAFLESRSSTP